METTKRSSDGIRQVLFQELDNLRNGTSTPSRANAIARTAAQILSTVKLEIDYADFIKSSGAKVTKVESLMLE